MVKWENSEDGLLEAVIPASEAGRDGHYQVWIQRRPHYCDRGRVLVNVDSFGVLPLDDQEGWPRYFFGMTINGTQISAEEVAKSQIEEWAKMRQSVQTSLKKQASKRP